MNLSLKNIFLFLSVFTFSALKSQTGTVTGYEWGNRKYISHYLVNGILNIKTDHGLVQAIPYSPKIVEIKNFYGDVPVKDSSDAVIMSPENMEITVKDEPENLRMILGSLTVVFNKNPFSIIFYYNDELLLPEERGFFIRNDSAGIRFKLDDSEESFYGLGERAVDFSLRGGKYRLYNQANYGYVSGADFLNYSVPLLVSSKKYMLLFDNPEKGYVDLGKTEKNIMEFGAVGGVMKYFFIAGDDFKELSTEWGKLSGMQPLPPFWALGNLQSRMGYKSQKEADSIVTLMRENNFPLDALIIDLFWFGDSLKGYMGKLEWNKRKWPQPGKMMEKFKDVGVKTVLITEPYIIDTLKNFYTGDSLGIFTTDSTGKTYINKDFYFGPAGLIDIFKSVAGRWFWEKYKNLARMGVSGWWGDLGEPEYHPSDEYHVNGPADAVHNVYAHYWHKMLYENYRQFYPGIRLFNLNRAGYAGSQRYSVFPWTGDVSRSWGGLKAQIPALLHAGLSGLPYVHSDAGGFAGGKKDDELYTRWLQFACFTPILRPHGDAFTAPSEPVFYSEQTQKIVRKYIKLRYSLLPYIYSMSAQATLKGYPLMRTLFFEFPDDWMAFETKDEYMFGSNILVAPVLNPGQRIRTVYLPRNNKWYNYFTNRKMPGGNEYDIPVKIDNIPLFVKAGSFLPVVKPVSSTDYYSDSVLTIKYYVGDDESRDHYLMYSDDRKEPDAIKNGNFETLMFVQKKNEKGNLEFMFSRIKGYKKMPREREISLEIIGLPYNKYFTFIINGKQMEKIKTKKPADNGYLYDEQRKVWLLRFKWGLNDVFITQSLK